MSTLIQIISGAVFFVVLSVLIVVSSHAEEPCELIIDDIDYCQVVQYCKQYGKHNIVEDCKSEVGNCYFDDTFGLDYCINEFEEGLRI